MKLLPSAENEEKGLLGAFMRSPIEVGAKTAARGLCASAMHLPANGAILETLQTMWREQKPIDAITLTSELKKRGELEQVGGVPYVMELTDYMPSMALVDQYIATLEEKRALRGIITACQQFGERAYDEREDAPQLVSELLDTATALASATTQKQRRTMKELLMAKNEAIVSESIPDNTIRTGIGKIDLESPLCMGDMPIITGETKAGKSILALTIATNIATKEGRPVIYFSLEDSAEKPLDRIISGIARIPIVEHHKSRLSDGGFKRLQNAIQTVAEARLVIRDDVQDLGSIIAAIRQFRAKYPDAGAAIVDYAQLVSTPVRKNETREREIASISRAFRLLAIELHMPIIVLAQLNANGETRESKALENDMTAHWQLKTQDGEPNKRLLTIPRQRNGSSGIAFPLTFLGHFARFEDYADE